MILKDPGKEELRGHMICVSESEIRRVKGKNNQIISIVGMILFLNYSAFNLFFFCQVLKAEKEAKYLKGSMRKRMEFLDMD